LPPQIGKIAISLGTELVILIAIALRYRLPPPALFSKLESHVDMVRAVVMAVSATWVMNRLLSEIDEFA
jgi:hypothetical protein